MKITEIRARNVLGARDIDARMAKPVTLFCGFNGAGKSSMQESLRLAMQGETLRVSHKKDFGLMVTDGAKEGFVRVVADDQVYEYKLPTGEHTTPASAVSAIQLNSVLNAQRFATMTPDERREFLTVLTKSKPDKHRIKALMLEAGIDEARIEPAIAMLTAGFPAACEMAKAKATEAKGAWKQVAGGTWGSIKGENWEAPQVEAPAAEAIEQATTDLADKETELAELQQQLGANVEKFNEQLRRKAEIDAAKIKVAHLPRLREKLIRDQEALESYAKELAELAAKAGTAPKKGLIHDLATFVNSLDFSGDQEAAMTAAALVSSYENEYGDLGRAGDPDALARLPTIQKSRDLMKSCVDNCLRDIAAAEQAEAMLATLATLETVGDNLITDVKASIAELEKELAAARKSLKTMQDLAKAASERETRTADAKKHHADVIGWLKVADQLAPDGIPSQILSKALAPINKALRAAAMATEWRQVTIAPDMTITADGRLYTLHSESERWMIDAMISAVISQISGLKLIVLDRFDVLDVRHRPALLYWLSDLAEAGEIDSALVFGTLKERPKGMPDNIEAIWIDGGELAQDDLYNSALAA